MGRVTMKQLLILLTFAVACKGSGQGYSSCEAFFQEKNTCPPFDYNETNRLCCRHEPGKMLHCVNTRNNSIVFGCFKDQLIPAGNAMSLEPTDSPRAIRLVPCKPGDMWFEPDSRNSSAVYQSYCTKPRTMCSLPGKIMVCRGNETADNQCGCADGYEPMYEDTRCWKGFTDNDFCPCQEKECPNGTGRNMTRIFAEPCPRERVLLDYTCYLTDSSSTATIPFSKSLSSRLPPHNSTSPPPVEAASGHNLNWLWLIPIFLLTIIVAIIFRKQILRWFRSNFSGFSSQRGDIIPTLGHNNKGSHCCDPEGDNGHQAENTSFLTDDH